MNFDSFYNSFIDLFTKQDSLLQFSTIKFWILFVVFFAFFISIRNKKRTLMMAYVIVFSLFIAYKANGWYMLLLPATVMVSWALTEAMKKASSQKARKWWLAAIVVIDLLPLVYFKYTNFFASTLNSIFHSNFALLDIVLPVGLSFYTFQAISYSVDTYRQKITYNVDLLEYAFYITFFPLLFAGPITRTDTLVPQLRQTKRVDRQLVNTGFWLIILGLLKKGLIADYIAEYNNWIFDDPTAYSGFEVLMGTIGFHVQLYCDFSGYSDMAIGLAAIMGFKLLPNFNSPYKSLNVTEFWRRWHISLSTWFRDYLYIPMGGNRKGQVRTYLNNFVTMVVAGLWHGASWMFVIWGAIHGAALVVHKACKKRFLDKIKDTKWVKLVAWTITMITVWTAWVFFRSKDMGTLSDVFSKVFTDFDWAYLQPFVQRRTMWVVFVLIALLLHACLPEKWEEKCRNWVVNAHWLVKLIIFAVVVQLIINFSQNGVQPMLYSQF